MRPKTVRGVFCDWQVPPNSVGCYYHSSVMHDTVTGCHRGWRRGSTRTHVSTRTCVTVTWNECALWKASLQRPENPQITIMKQLSHTHTHTHSHNPTYGESWDVRINSVLNSSHMCSHKLYQHVHAQIRRDIIEYVCTRSNRMLN